MKKYRAYLFEAPTRSKKGAYKYFGKSVQPDVTFASYKGSGKGWKPFLRKHNLDRSSLKETVWVFNDQETLTKFCLMYSEMHDIVSNPDYFNQQIEDGISGGSDTCKEETKRKISEANKGKVLPDHVKKLISERFKGCTLSEEHKAKIGAAHKGRTYSDETITKMSKARMDKGVSVICIETGEEFTSATTASRKHNIDASGIVKVCKGKRKTCGGFHWKYKEE